MEATLLSEEGRGCGGAQWRAGKMSTFVWLAVLLVLCGCSSDGGGTADPGTGPGSTMDAGVGPMPDAGTNPMDDDGSLPDGDVTPPAPAPDVSVDGPYAVDIEETDIRRGNRSIDVAVHKPRTRGAYPMIVFMPGFQLKTKFYLPLVQRWASHGFIVVRVDAPGGIFDVSHVEMTADVQFVIDWALEQESIWSIHDGTIAASGHSLGGKLASMTTGADARVAALLGIDPVNGGNPFSGFNEDLPDVLPAAVEGKAIPMGFFGELTDATASGGGTACAPAAGNYAHFFSAATSSPWVVSWEIEGADHMDFVFDKSGCGLNCGLCKNGDADEESVRDKVLRLSTAFWLKHLSHVEGFDALLTGAELPEGVNVMVSTK